MYILGVDVPILEIIIYFLIGQIAIIVIQVILFIKTIKYYNKIEDKATNNASPATTAQ